MFALYNMIQIKTMLKMYNRLKIEEWKDNAVRLCYYSHCEIVVIPNPDYISVIAMVHVKAFTYVFYLERDQDDVYNKATQFINWLECEKRSTRSIRDKLLHLGFLEEDVPYGRLYQ